MKKRKKRSKVSVFLAWLLALTTAFSGVMAAPVSDEVQAADAPQYRNVMYYGDWSIYAGQNYFYVSKIDGSLITHLNFAFMDVDENGELVLCDEHADFLNTSDPSQTGLTYGDPYAGVFGAMAILRSKYPNMKIGVSVGGWTRTGDLPKLAANESTRKNFAKNIAKFVDYLGFDFVDIDWEYPGAYREPDPEGNGVTIDKGCLGSDADTVNYTLTLQAIRDELDALGEANGKHYELSVAMSASPAMMDYIEYDKVLQIVDFANMMTYDLNGAWNNYTGHQTALYTNPAYDSETQKDGVFSVDTCVKYLEEKYGNSIDYSKVVIGVAPYTRGWKEVQNDAPDSATPGLYATATGENGVTYAYGDIETLKSQYQLTEYWDDVAKASYFYSESSGYFFTCDTERSVTEKGKYVKEKGLGGLISWMASLDSANSITQTMKEALYGDSALPAQDIVVTNPNTSVQVTASGSQYTITIKNNETTNETNTALKDAEAFKETITYPKLYIKTKSGATFSAGSESGTVTNENGIGVIDLSSVYAAKSIKAGASHTFTVNVSGTADIDDIEGITMTQRIMASMDEFGSQAVYGEGVDNDVIGGDGGNSGDNGNTSGNTGTDTGTDKDTETGKTPTGSYDPWEMGKAYAVGDLVSYNDKVYECTIAHTSNSDPTWAPDAGILWKERTDLVNTPSNPTTDPSNPGSGDEENQNNYYVNGALPQHMVTGYWHNFVNGSANLKLGDVPEYYDMICVAFTGNTQTAGEVTFELDGDLCNALGGYTKEQFIQDIKDLKAKGQHVIVSVGGAEGRIEIKDDASATLFAEGLIDIIEEYGFEGVDIDLEGAAVTGVDYIADSLRTVYNHFNNKDFIITMAPETYYIQADRLSSNDITTSYLRLALKIQDILTICYPQFYNSGGMNGYGGSIVNPGNADFLTSLSTLVIETGGLRPDQVAIGVPSTSQAASSGYVSTDVVKTAFNAMINGTSSGSFTAPQAYPTFRGVMTWSINWDATQNYAWAKAMSEAMDAAPVVDNGSTDSGDAGNQGNTGSENQGNTGSENTGNTGSENQGNTGSENTGNTGSENTGNTGNENTGSTGNENTGNTGSENTGNTGNQNQDNTGNNAQNGNTQSEGNVQNSVQVGETFNAGKLAYKVTEASENTFTVQVVKPLKKTNTKITIPATVKYKNITFTVTSIAENAFKNNNKLKSVLIGKNVVSIGKNAFSGCKKMTTVTIGKNVTTIEAKAFYNCKKLSKVTFKGTKVKKVGSKVFVKTSSKLRIKVNKKKITQYAKLLKKKIPVTAKITK